MMRKSRTTTVTPESEGTHVVDVPFAQLLAQYDVADDALVAALIEQDGRMRIAHDLPTTLERYIEAVPDLMQRHDALDAAIDVTLRWMTGGPRADAQSVERLVAQYPSLEEEIRDAAALSHALWSTAGLRKKVAGNPDRPLPQDFGPIMEDGQCRFVLQNLIGVGAFGEVYKAVDRQLSEEGHPALVAIKILTDTGDDDFHTGKRLLARPRLLEEATKARRVNHPNVVRVLDRGVAGEGPSGGEAYIVYDFIEGGDLDRWIQSSQRRIPVREAAMMVARIARGVQAAHSAGLVHCDLKPGNIILTAEGEPKVADFGIAVRFGQSRQGDAAVESFGEDHPIGNVAFISPEQYRMDEGALTVPSDIYALGGILFLLLTGQLPNGSSLKEIAQTHDPEHGRTEPPRVRTLRPEVDRDLEAICRRAMALSPEDRYSAAGAFADDLDAWLRSEPLYWTNPSATHVIRLWSRRRPAVAVSWLMVIFSVLASSAAITHYARRAASAEVVQAQAEMDAEIARIRRAEADAREEEIRGVVERLRASLAQGSRTASEVLSIVWAIESVLLPRLVASHSELENLQRARFNVAQRAVDQAQRDGRSNDLESILWKSSLAFWLVSAGDAEKAWPLLEELDEQWRAMLHPSDRWLMYFQAIKSCATVVKLSDAAQLQPLSESDLATLRGISEFLEQTEQFAREHDPKSAVHLLVIDNLIQLYQPHLLDDSSSLVRTRAILDRLGIRSDYERRQ